MTPDVMTMLWKECITWATQSRHIHWTLAAAIHAMVSSGKLQFRNRHFIISGVLSPPAPPHTHCHQNNCGSIMFIPALCHVKQDLIAEVFGCHIGRPGPPLPTESAWWAGKLFLIGYGGDMLGLRGILCTARSRQMHHRHTAQFIHPCSQIPTPCHADRAFVGEDPEDEDEWLSTICL